MNITLEVILLAILVVMSIAQFKTLYSMLGLIQIMTNSMQRWETIDYKVDQLGHKLTVIEIKIEKLKSA